MQGREVRASGAQAMAGEDVGPWPVGGGEGEKEGEGEEERPLTLTLRPSKALPHMLRCARLW